MALIQIAAFLIVTAGLAWKAKEKIVDVLPMAVCVLILLLYGLSFAGKLYWLDWINIIVLVGSVILLLKTGRQRSGEITGKCVREFLHPGSIAFFIAVVVVTVCVADKAVTWWDDYNFWATDVKALYAMNGFTGKYANVAPEFGDYPPGTQMIKWWFLHLNPGAFKEGLMFAGYYAMNMAFLAPLLKNLSRRRIWVILPALFFLWAFPSVAESFYLSGMCADLTMAVLYGSFLAAVLDEKNHCRLFYYTRLTLLLSVLVLCKNVGFLWVSFGLLFFFLYRILIWRREEKISFFKRTSMVLAVSVLPVIIEASWLLFCLIMRRVARLTGAAVSMAVGNMGIPDVNREMVSAFLEAFFLWPLHKWKTIALDLTPFALYLFLLVGVGILWKKNCLEQKTARFLGLFFGLSGLFFYGLNLVSHLTIFAVEEQYLQPFGMISSIERYGAPFMIGSLYVLIFLWINHKRVDATRAYMICFMLIFLCVDYKLLYEGIWGYRSEIQEVQDQRAEIIGEESNQFLTVLSKNKTVKGEIEKGGIRVLYLRDGRKGEWVKNAYLNFEAAPISLMHKGIDPDQISLKLITESMEEAHTVYLYLDNLGEEAKIKLNETVGDGAFSYGNLYKLEYSDTEAMLRLVH